LFGHATCRFYGNDVFKGCPAKIWSFSSWNLSEILEFVNISYVKKDIFSVLVLSYFLGSLSHRFWSCSGIFIFEIHNGGSRIADIFKHDVAKA